MYKHKIKSSIWIYLYLGEDIFYYGHKHELIAQLILK